MARGITRREWADEAGIASLALSQRQDLVAIGQLACSELPRRFARLALEDDAHVLGVFEPGERGDLFQRKRSRLQEFFATFDLHEANGGLGRTAEELAEVAFEPAT